MKKILALLICAMLVVASMSALAEGERIGLFIDPDAIHIMQKSEYSGLYGDYSSFSNELDELADPDADKEAEG